MLLPSSTRKTIPCLGYYIQGQCQCNPTAGSRVDAVLDILRGVAVMNIQSKQRQQLPAALASEIGTRLHGFATSAPVAFASRSNGCRCRSTLWQTCSSWGGYIRSCRSMARLVSASCSALAFPAFGSSFLARGTRKSAKVLCWATTCFFLNHQLRWATSCHPAPKASVTISWLCSDAHLSKLKSAKY